MGIKSILVHLDNGSNAQARVAAAAALARQHDAHLIGLAPTGWIALPPGGALAWGAPAYQQATLEQQRANADECVRRFLKQADGLGVMSFEGRVATGYAAETMILAARYCDLTVVTQFNPDESGAAQSPQMPQDLLLESGRPVLVLPYAGECDVPPDARVLVGWDGSREAARAMRDALPLMRTAASVEVVVFDKPEDVDARHGPLPGADIGLWLARHGLNVKVNYVPIKVAAGAALLSHAADMGAQLIVAGGYGHSRFRESVLGGVTRTLVTSSPVPVLFSH